ncbi:extracellular solute-binding protein [Paenibacillus hodogayensis]|uniref:Extracellular solute-binding protein n=1 Tax=Paenibacillus hodogayensis TaxID=279208 RepID=A0ABV5VVB9_9BACL
MAVGTVIRLIVLLMVTALSGCQRIVETAAIEPSNGSTGENQSMRAERPARSGAAIEIAALGKDRYDAPITLTTIRTNEPGVRFDAGDSYGDNEWIRAYERELGIRVKMLWTEDSVQYNRKLDLLIASGDIPDFFRVNGTQLRQLIDSGLIADLSAVYAASASDKVKKLLEERGKDPFVSATVNGKLMAIPSMSMMTENAAVLHVRSDWLEKLNLSMPDTLSDVLNMSRAFTTQDPDGNGMHDTFGLAVDQNFTLANGFLNGFHAYRGIWIGSGSKLAYSSVQPEMKQALSGLRDLYAAGQIDPDFGMKDESKVYESIAGGKIGMFYSSPFAGSFPLQQAKKRNPSMEWKAVPLPSVDGSRALPQVVPGSGYWVVNKEVQHPEAIFRLLDFWVETFYDNKSDDLYYKYNQSKDNNPVWKMNAIAVTKEYKNVEESLRIIEAIDKKDRSKLTPEDKGVLQRIESYVTGGAVDGWMWNYMFNKGGTLSIADYYRRNNLYKREQFTSIPLPNLQRKSSELGKLEAETFTKIVLGLMPVADFDRFVEQWKAAGGDDITNEVNDWYRNNQ